ncbi:hypothetical protein ACHAQA_001802 [Verticillium albo-atrum]
MKAAASIILAASALATAQVTFNETTGVFTCAKPGVAYCAGGSLDTDIIIRCNNASIGQPGRCTDNLAGQPPLGVNPALCFQTSETAGDAACEKNCIVYPEDGSASFTLPADQCKQTGTGSNSTTTTTAPGKPYPTGPHGNATHVPVGPTGTTTSTDSTSTDSPPDSVPTAAASRNGVGALAIAFLAAVYFF